MRNCALRNGTYPEFCPTAALTEEEIIEFARKTGVKKIGIATCIGLLEESRIFAKILRLNGFEVYGISCKVASVDKTGIGIDKKYTCVTGKVMCNPIMQAKLLNKAKTDLNNVDLRYPRDRNNAEFIRIRNEILQILDFAGKEHEPEYMN